MASTSRSPLLFSKVIVGRQQLWVHSISPRRLSASNNTQSVFVACSPIKLFARCQVSQPLFWSLSLRSRSHPRGSPLFESEQNKRSGGELRV
jgi:hypothetical protein